MSGPTWITSFELSLFWNYCSSQWIPHLKLSLFALCTTLNLVTNGPFQRLLAQHVATSSSHPTGLLMNPESMEVFSGRWWGIVVDGRICEIPKHKWQFMKDTIHNCLTIGQIRAFIFFHLESSIPNLSTKPYTTFFPKAIPNFSLRHIFLDGRKTSQSTSSLKAPFIIQYFFLHRKEEDNISFNFVDQKCSSSSSSRGR